MAREEERTLEYAFSWQPGKPWAVQGGARFRWYYGSDVDDDDIINSEVHVKVSRIF